MKYQRVIVLLAMCAAIAACDMSNFNYSGKNGRITLDSDVLTLHVDGVPNATLGSSGDFTIDGKAVSLSPTQHGLLMLYYQGVMDIREQALGMGKAGAAAGVEALKNSMSSKPDPNEKKKIDDQVSSQTHQLSLKMCQDEANLKAVQDQLTAQIPVFKPYGGIFPGRSIDECMKDN
ncbi:hypothetical protein [Dyella acidisoli]|uniref:DUF2884 family protein n=1 Tax=Dyella acidisoli TaxID=1867834 RepID=A0ABQ5XVK2_9GAMM|nr:hypothetical protein [Dyella acidisoli]GLQ95367.1 hypothetical protein GCM10007901_43220 [Dyella acidisoli]